MDKLIFSARRFREQRKMFGGQADFAAKSSIDEKTIRNYESGRTKPDATRLRGIARDLGVSPNTICVPALCTFQNIPRRSRFFMGRDKALAGLRNARISSRATTITQTISGLGGIGKTQLALAYYHECAGDMIVWWIRAQSNLTITDDLMKFAQALMVLNELPEQDDTAQILAGLRGWLAEEPQCLVVFDNAISAESLIPFLPEHAKAQIVITSRAQDWNGVAEAVQLSVLGNDAAVKLLTCRSQDTDNSAAKQIAKELGCLPLALEHAGAYCAQSGKTLSNYLELLKTKRKQLMAVTPAHAEYDVSVAATIFLSVELACMQYNLAGDLLDALVWLDSDNIDPAWFKYINNLQKKPATILHDEIATD